VKRTGHYYCYPCFMEKAREKEVIQNVNKSLYRVQTSVRDH
jgi:hypothetical protein